MLGVHATGRVETDVAARLSRALWALARLSERIQDPDVYWAVQAELRELERIEADLSPV